MQFHDPELAKMAETATALDAKAYSGGWVQLLNWDMPEQGTTPAAVNSFTTTTSICTAQRPFIPANSVNVGTLFRIKAWGTLGSAAGTANTTIGLALNGTGGTVICASAAQTPATSTVLGWWAEFMATVLTIGSGGTIIGGGWAIGLNATPATAIIIPASGAASVAINTTIVNNLTVNATWTASNAGNTFTTYGMTAEQLN